MPTATAVLGIPNTLPPSSMASVDSDSSAQSAWELCPERVAAFLPLRDASRGTCVSRGWASAATEGEVMVAQLFVSGLSTEVRWDAWLAIAGARRRREQDSVARSESAWRRSDHNGSEAAQSGIGLDGKDGLKEDGVEGQILRDVRRTFPRHPLFLDPDGEGQALLANILKRLARFDATLQYCQGMNYVVGFLLMVALRCATATELDSSFVRRVYQFRTEGGEDMVFWQMVTLLDRPRYRMRGKHLFYYYYD